MAAETSALAPASLSTKERLLDAAERQFAERGYEGASMRAITRAAGVSVSAANYHFGSKRDLLHATLRRRVEPVNARRLERLGEIEARAADEPPSVESILEAFVDPHFEAREASGGEPMRRVIARVYADPRHVISDLEQDLFGALITRFVDALGRVLPSRSPECLRVDFHFAIGVMVHVLGGHLDVLRDARGALPLGNDELKRRLVHFMAGGLRAGSPGGGRP